MTDKIVQSLAPFTAYPIKCPYSMTPTRIVIHNTGNDAPAKNEIAYMTSNTEPVSFHFAVDDKEIVQGISLNRNTWNAGDGNGKGNREGISIEICYSKSGGERFIKAEENAAQLTAWLLDLYGWDISKVTKHQDYNGKYCPHRTLDMGWQRFLNMVKACYEKKETTKEEDMTKSEVLEIIKEYEQQQTKQPVSSWAEKYWKSAVGRGIFDGSMPQSPLTREQCAKVLSSLGTDSLSDSPECPDYAKESWSKAADAEIFDGNSPCAPLTRAQAAVMLDRIGALDATADKTEYGI